MSTRAQIIVAGSKVVIYRHSDGYPDTEHGVLASLVPLVKKFLASRYWEPEYLTAQIVSDQIRLKNLWVNEAITEVKESHPGIDTAYLERERLLGFEVEAFEGEFHGDTAYVYIVNEHGIEVFEANNKFWDNPVIQNLNKVKVVEYDPANNPAKMAGLTSNKQTASV